MTLMTLRDEPDRLEALADILCGAATSDEHVAAQEIEVVRTRLEQLLGMEVLPEAIHARLARFDPERFDLRAAVDRLGLSTDEDREAVLAAALDVIAADRFVDMGEYGYVAELAGLLDLAVPRALR